MSRAVLSALAASILVAGCGSGVPHEEIMRAASGVTVAVPGTARPESAGPVASETAAAVSGASSPADASGAGATPGVAGAAQPSGAAPAAGTAAGGPASVAKPAAGAPTAGQGSTRPSGVAGGSTSSTAPSQGAATGCPAPCRPVVIGSVGTYSGPVGNSVANGTKGVQAWARSVNAAGGLGGHAVEVIVADDGADPARHRALVQQLVESRGVIAFVYNSAPLSGQSSIDYVTAKRIPVIGSEGSSEWFYQSPMFFPQVTSGKVQIVSPVVSGARIALPQGWKKLGVIACSDGVQACEDGKRGVPEYGPKVGFDVVWQGSASIAQPDYTGECLAARNNGAQVIAVYLDTNATQRFARSCKSVGYSPKYLIAHSILTDDLATDPNFEGAIGASITAPWIDPSLPAIGEYHTVMKRNAPGVDISGSTILGYGSAKLFERAARTLDGQPTAQNILDGLWSIHNDNLGGLTFPLTFVRDKTADRPLCAAAIVAENGKWVPQPNGRFECLPV